MQFNEVTPEEKKRIMATTSFKITMWLYVAIVLGFCAFVVYTVFSAIFEANQV